MTVAKAIAAFCATTVGVVTTVAADGHVTLVEAIIGACTVIAATASVWRVENTPTSSG